MAPTEHLLETISSLQVAGGIQPDINLQGAPRGPQTTMV